MIPKFWDKNCLLKYPILMATSQRSGNIISTYNLQGCAHREVNSFYYSSSPFSQCFISFHVPPCGCLSRIFVTCSCSCLLRFSISSKVRPRTLDQKRNINNAQRKYRNKPEFIIYVSNHCQVFNRYMIQDQRVFLLMT